jgi:hypothetical protein
MHYLDLILHCTQTIEEMKLGLENLLEAFWDNSQYNAFLGMNRELTYNIMSATEFFRLTELLLPWQVMLLSDGLPFWG